MRDKTIVDKLEKILCTVIFAQSTEKTIDATFTASFRKMSGMSSPGPASSDDSPVGSYEGPVVKKIPYEEPEVPEGDIPKITVSEVDELLIEDEDIGFKSFEILDLLG